MNDSASMHRHGILVVEDDLDAQQLLKMLLVGRYEVWVAASGEEMYARIEESQGRIDLILMDISLAGSRDGLDLTRELRATEEWRDLPIVAVTAHSDHRQRALDSGCNAFVEKPYHRKQLLALVESFLDAGVEV